VHVVLVWGLPTPQPMPTVGSRRILPHLVSNRESREWTFEVPRSELVCKSYGCWKWRLVSFIICCDCIMPLPSEPYNGCPYPCPWVSCGHGCDTIVHGWAWAPIMSGVARSILCIPASSSKSESNFSDGGNTLTKKHSRLKPTTMNDLLFVRSNQDLV
jgi:hypothetical protein